MSRKRRQHSDQFKFKVALEASKGQQTVNQLASEHQLHPTQISSWKKPLLKEGASVFSRTTSSQEQEQTRREAELYEHIGRLKMELEWLKKKLPPSIELRRSMIETSHPRLSIRRQCDLVGLNRATFYHQPAAESVLNRALMRQIDEEYTRTPFYGYRKMTARLHHLGYSVNRKRVARLMGVMGLQAIYPRPRTSGADQQQHKYPYLLRGVSIIRPNQVWSADITYVPMTQGFMYLVALMDWFSRFVLTWQLSNTLDGLFCVEALRLALQQGQPEIFNTDQGVQFTAHDFTDELARNHIRISMDGRGRAFDNIFSERLWRSVKYEDIYLHDYGTVGALEKGLGNYFQLYNYERPHQSLAYWTPAAVHFSEKATIIR